MRLPSYIKKLGLSVIVVLMNLSYCADAMAQPHVIITGETQAIRVVDYEGARVNGYFLSVDVKNVGTGAAERVAIWFDCRSCASDFDADSAYDGWSQIVDNHLLTYVAAGEAQRVELLVAVKPYRGAPELSPPEEFNVSIGKKPK